MRGTPVVSGALTVRAIVGTYAVLLGFDIDPQPPADFLGFAIHRTDLQTADAFWLPNFLRFAVNDHPDGPTGSDRNPLQAFQWGDYTTLPGQQLRYKVAAILGTPDTPRQGDVVEFDVTCESADDGTHGVWFNRGVAGSQAYTRKFGTGSPLDIPDAATWMSRGLEEALLAFIARAEGSGWALRGAFYEFMHAPVLEALHKAARREVDVGLAVACPSAGGWPDYPSWHNIEAIHGFPGAKKPPPGYKGLSTFVTPRHNAKDIAHNKFLVLLHDGAPQAVWTGSTNITAGALYGHSNVGHLVSDPAVAATYLAYWELLHADNAGPQMTAFTEEHTPLTAIKDTGTSALFSPRSDTAALDYLASLITAAKESIFVTGPFGLAPQLSAALASPRDIPRYELLESEDSTLMKALRADPGNEVTAGAFLGAPGGWHQFLQEHLTGLNDHVRFIHTKYLLVDPLSADPTIVTGSANFSKNSIVNNDENMLVIRGDTRVADIYLTEFMRLFTHLRFRAKVAGTSTAKRAPDPAEPAISSPIHLVEDGSWAAPFYAAGKPKARERRLFSGGA